MLTMDIYGMQGALDNVTLMQVNLTENIICIKKLTINLLIRYMENNWDIKIIKIENINEESIMVQNT